MFLQDFVMSHIARGARIFVVDIGRSFEKSCKVMGGDFVEFGTGSKVSLNPFVNIASGTSSADSAGDMLSMLKMVIAKMAAPKTGTKDIEDATIAESLNEVWEKYKNKADIDKLIQVLNEKGEIGKNLARMLFEFSSKGSYGKFFSGSNTIKFDNQFTVLEFEELLERPELGGVIMQMLSIQIIQQIYLGDRKQRFIILFDEAWYALSNFPMLLASIAKTIRKYNGGLVIGTQGWNDFYGMSLGALSDADKARISVMENSAWRISLKQNINDEQARSRGFEDGQIALIKSLETIDGKYAEMLISKSHDEYFVGRLALDKFSQVLYSSSPKVFASVKSYIDSGMSVADSVEKTMRDIHG